MEEKEKEILATTDQSQDEIIDKIADELLDKYLPAFMELAK